MSRFSSGVKSGEVPAYDEIMLPRKGQDVRHAPSRMPWYNPRYWRKRVWAGVATIVVIIIIVVVAVAVSESRKNRYPDYSALEYSLADTCRLITAYIYRKQALTNIQMEESPSSTSSTTSLDTTPVSIASASITVSINH